MNALDECLLGGQFVPQQDSAEIFRNINRDAFVYAATISTDELEVLYTRTVRKDGAINFQNMRATRPGRDVPFGKPSVIKSITGFSEAPAPTGDGRLIYYHKKDPAGIFRLFALHRQAGNDW